MYRIVVGLDTARQHEAAVRLLVRLRPEGAVIDSLHAVEIPASLYATGDAWMAATDAIISSLRAEEETGRELGEKVGNQLLDAGLIPGAAEVRFGTPVRELIEYADRTSAGLIVVGCGGKGPLRTLLLGSVGRGLIVGAHQSILIAKESPDESRSSVSDGPLHAVFATDHSHYADRCIPRLLEMAPRGIARLTVLTCYPRAAIEAVRPVLPEFVADPAEWLTRNLAERNEKVIQELTALGCAFDSQVLEEPASVGIAHYMREHQPDLLILGAQGHGFFERLTLGSTSFRFAVAEPYSVLVLRVPPAPV